MRLKIAVRYSQNRRWPSVRNHSSSITFSELHSQFKFENLEGQTSYLELRDLKSQDITGIIRRKNT